MVLVPLAGHTAESFLLLVVCLFVLVGLLCFLIIDSVHIFFTVHSSHRAPFLPCFVNAQVNNKLAHILPPRNLTVQVVKDDWMAAAMPVTPHVHTSAHAAALLERPPKLDL